MTTNLNLKHEYPTNMSKHLRKGLDAGSVFIITRNELNFVLPTIQTIRTTETYKIHRGEMNTNGFHEQLGLGNKFSPKHLVDYAMSTELLQVHRTNDAVNTCSFLVSIYTNIIAMTDEIFEGMWIDQLPTEADNIQYSGEFDDERLNIYENDGRTLAAKVIDEYLTAVAFFLPSMDVFISHGNTQVFKPVIDVEAQEREKQEKTRKQAAYKAKNKATRKTAQKVRSRAKR